MRAVLRALVVVPLLLTPGSAHALGIEAPQVEAPPLPPATPDALLQTFFAARNATEKLPHEAPWIVWNLLSRTDASWVLPMTLAFLTSMAEAAQNFTQQAPDWASQVGPYYGEYVKNQTSPTVENVTENAHDPAWWTARVNDTTGAWVEWLTNVSGYLDESRDGLVNWTHTEIVPRAQSAPQSVQEAANAFVENVAREYGLQNAERWIGYAQWYIAWELGNQNVYVNDLHAGRIEGGANLRVHDTLNMSLPGSGDPTSGAGPTAQSGGANLNPFGNSAHTGDEERSTLQELDLFFSIDPSCPSANATANARAHDRLATASPDTRSNGECGGTPGPLDEAGTHLAGRSPDEDETAPRPSGRPDDDRAPAHGPLPSAIPFPIPAGLDLGDVLTLQTQARGDPWPDPRRDGEDARRWNGHANVLTFGRPDLGALNPDRARDPARSPTTPPQGGLPVDHARARAQTDAPLKTHVQGQTPSAERAATDLGLLAHAHDASHAETRGDAKDAPANAPARGSRAGPPARERQIAAPRAPAGSGNLLDDTTRAPATAPLEGAAASTAAPHPAPAPWRAWATTLIVASLAALFSLAGALTLRARLRAHSLLAQQTRAHIVDALRANPGATASDLARALGVDRTTAKYHLHVLVKMRMAREHKLGKERQFALAGTPEAQDPARCATAAVARKARVQHALDVVRAQPGLTIAQLTGTLAITKASAHRLVRALEKRDLLAVDRARRDARLFPGAGAATAATSAPLDETA